MSDRKMADLSDAQIAQLKRVGFWQSEREPDLPHPRDYVDPAWDAQERDRVIDYLDRSYWPPYLMFGYALCRMGCPPDPPDIGTQDLTDGTWIFPEGLAHYIRHHALKPPSDFLEHIRACNYIVPVLAELPDKPSKRTAAQTPQAQAPQPPPPPKPAAGNVVACFVCGAEAKSFFRSQARAACGACHHRTRLVVGGASLPAILKTTRSSPLEGNGLNAVLNPVEIDGRRGWASFFGGSFQVLEEIRPSRDYFEFALQHLEPGPSILGAIRAAGLSAKADMKQLFAVLIGMEPAHDVSKSLAALPYLPLKAETAVAAFLPIMSNEQAWKAAEARMANDGAWTPDDHRIFIARLVDVARRSG